MTRRITLTAAMALAMSSISKLAAIGRKQFMDILGSMRRYQKSVQTVHQGRRLGHSAKSPWWYGKAGYGNGLDQPRRLGRARGPGTINAKADGLQLARMGRFKEAAEMLDQQFPALAERYRGYEERGFPNWDTLRSFVP